MEVDAPLATFDLPVIPPEVVIVPEPVVHEVGRASETAAGGGGGSVAKAIRTRDVIVPSPIDLPVPVIDLKIPSTVVVPTAPVEGPVIIGTGGTGDGSGSGDGIGTGDGRGQGDGSGSGNGDGAGDGRGQRLRSDQAAEWIVKPSSEVMEAAYPFSARLEKITGTVLLSCRVKHQRARDCRIVAESPTGHDFGKAAMSVAYRGKIKAPVIADQDPASVRVSIPIIFERR